MSNALMGTWKSPMFCCAEVATDTVLSMHEATDWIVDKTVTWEASRLLPVVFAAAPWQHLYTVGQMPETSTPQCLQGLRVVVTSSHTPRQF